MLAVRKRHFEAVLAGDSLALPHGNVFESAFASFLKLSKHVGEKFVFLFCCKSSTSFALHFWEGENCSLHSCDVESTGHKLVAFGLPDFPKQEHVCTKVFLRGIEPEEGKSSIRI